MLIELSVLFDAERLNLGGDKTRFRYGHRDITPISDEDLA